MRKLPDWIEGFQALCAPRKVPPLFSEWAALACMSAFIQRRYWFLSDGRPSYPTLYVLLIGEPAVGKGIAMEPMEEILRELDGVNIAPDSLTVAALCDEFGDEDHKVYHTNGTDMVECNAVSVISKELQVFLPTYDPNILGRLINLWDFKGYSERTRAGKEKKEFPNAHLSLIAGTTPSYMANLLPDQAWEGGFMSRCVPVYCGTVAKRLFREEAESTNTQLFSQLIGDAKQIMDGMGRIRFAPCAMQTITEWHDRDYEPKQNHPKMRYYNERRLWNTLRLSLLYCVSRSGDQIERQDVERALSLMVNTESQMVELFKALKTGGDEQVMRECHHFVMLEYAKRDKAVPKAKVMRFLTSRVQTFRAEALLDAMVSADIFRVEQVPKVGPCYLPLNPEFD